MYIFSKCANGKFNVNLIKPGDGIFRDMKGYLNQSHKLGNEQQDLDNELIAKRTRHWVNFGIGPSGGDSNTPSVHEYYGAWRLRCGYDSAEVPIEINNDYFIYSVTTSMIYLFSDSDNF